MNESARGICEYDVNESKTDQLKTIYRETFFEAKERVVHPQGRSLPLVAQKLESQKITKEQLPKLRKGISYVDANRR